MSGNLLKAPHVCIYITTHLCGKTHQTFLAGIETRPTLLDLESYRSAISQHTSAWEL